MNPMIAWERLKASGCTPFEGSKFMYEFFVSFEGYVMSAEARQAFQRAGIDPRDIDWPQSDGEGGESTPSFLGPLPPALPGVGARRMPLPDGSRGEVYKPET